MIFNILEIITTVIFTYLALGSIYILLFSLASKLRLKNLENESQPINRIAVFAPVYAENEVILEASAQNLMQNYPKDKFDLIVVADDLKDTTITQLKEMGAKVVEVFWGDDRTKAKSLNFALDQLDPVYDIAVVLDADNVMDKDVLHQFNSAYNKGWNAVQGHRAAKNKNTNFAILDAISEEINNSIFRKGHRKLGLSAALIGSGMAFDYALFISAMKQIDAVSGFDKELELVLLKNKVSIKYLEEAVILDEKIQRSGDFEKQRRRWIHAQIHYLKKNTLKAFKALCTGNVDFFDKVLQFFLPPRLILLGVQTLACILVLIISLLFSTSDFSFTNSLLSKLWVVSWITTVAALVISIPSELLNGKAFKSLFQLPKAFFMMIISIMKNKSAKNKFIHTRHDYSDSEEQVEEKVSSN